MRYDVKSEYTYYLALSKDEIEELAQLVVGCKKLNYRTDDKNGQAIVEIQEVLNSNFGRLLQQTLHVDQRIVDA